MPYDANNLPIEIKRRYLGLVTSFIFALCNIVNCVPLAFMVDGGGGWRWFATAASLVSGCALIISIRDLIKRPRIVISYNGFKASGTIFGEEFTSWIDALDFKTKSRRHGAVYVVKRRTGKKAVRGSTFESLLGKGWVIPSSEVVRLLAEARSKWAMAGEPPGLGRQDEAPTTGEADLEKGSRSENSHRDADLGARRVDSSRGTPL